jgi:hypothetical protein
MYAFRGLMTPGVSDNTQVLSEVDRSLVARWHFNVLHEFRRIATRGRNVNGEAGSIKSAKLSRRMWSHRTHVRNDRTARRIGSITLQQSAVPSS